ncbi:MAG: efflux RND transporter periplasmic adaptor subunit [Candidatus Rariloculaceae bacterium]
MKNIFIFVISLVAVGAVGVWYGNSGALSSIAVGGPRPGAGAPGGGRAPGFGGPGAGAVVLVVAEAARMDQLYDAVEAIGTAQANESLVLTAKVTDSVRRVNFEDGQYVEAGTVLIELTNEEEEALLDEARANLEDAENQLRRLEDLSSQGLSAESELDIARSRAAASAARLETVLARLRDRLIQAPFTGLLGFRDVSPGTLVTPATAITTLDDISLVKLDFTVPETYLRVMEPGAVIFARSASWGEREFEGVVRTVNSRVDPVTRAFVVRAHIDNEDGALRPGMLLTVRVVTQRRQALIIPESAILQSGARAYVYLVGADNIARQRDIEIASRQFGIVEVGSGLAPGDRVVTEGLIKLRDGVSVRFPDDSGMGEVSGLPAVPGMGMMPGMGMTPERTANPGA